MYNYDGFFEWPTYKTKEEVYEMQKSILMGNGGFRKANVHILNREQALEKLIKAGEPINFEFVPVERIYEALKLRPDFSRYTIDTGWLLEANETMSIRVCDTEIPLKPIDLAEWGD